MEPTDIKFDVTPEQVELLEMILHISADVVAPDWEQRGDLPMEVQKNIVQVVGAVVTKIVHEAHAEEE